MTYGSCFQVFANYEMDLQSVEKILAFPVLVMDLFFSDPLMIFCDWLLFLGKHLTFSFSLSYLSLWVSLILGKRENIANRLCYQTLKGQRCTGCLRESVKAIRSPISHLEANNPRGIPNGLPHINPLKVKDLNKNGIMVSISSDLIKL